MVYNSNMENIILNDLFTKEECEELIAMIEHELKVRPHVDIKHDENNTLINQDNVVMKDFNNGRIMAEILPTPEHIIEKLKRTLKDSYGDCEYIGTVFADYQTRFGTPRLGKHHDVKDDTTLIDYQLSSNTKWAINIDDVDYQLIDNQAVVLRPFKQLHGRPDKKFNDSEFVKMLFFFFTKPRNRE